MKYFINIDTLEALKKEYRKLAKKYHPDVSDYDTTDIMKEINKEYNSLFDQLKHDNKQTTNEQASTYKDIIDALIKYENLTIDIVGSWIWIYGKGTYTAKNTLGKLGFRWSKGKKKWYWFNGIKESKRRKGKGTYAEITQKYGYQRIQSKKDNKVLLTG